VKDAKTDRQLRLYVGLVAFAGLGCLTWAVGSFPAVSPGALLYSVAMIIIIASASGLLIEVRVRADHINFTSTSGAILVAVATVPLPLTVLCTAFGVLIAKVVLRDPIKITFNVAKNTIAATAAAVTAYLAGVRPSPELSFKVPSLPWLVGALVMAALAYAIVDELLGHAVVALATRTS